MKILRMLISSAKRLWSLLIVLVVLYILGVMLDAEELKSICQTDRCQIWVDRVMWLPETIEQGIRYLGVDFSDEVHDIVE